MRLSSLLHCRQFVAAEESSAHDTHPLSFSLIENNYSALCQFGPLTPHVTHGLLWIKESEDGQAWDREGTGLEEPNIEDRDRMPAWLTSHDDLYVFDLQYIWVHAGVHTHMHNRGRNAVCRNFPETQLSVLTGADHKSSQHAHSIFTFWPPFLCETFFL